MLSLYFCFICAIYGSSRMCIYCLTGSGSCIRSERMHCRFAPNVYICFRIHQAGSSVVYKMYYFLSFFVCIRACCSRLVVVFCLLKLAYIYMALACYIEIHWYSFESCSQYGRTLLDLVNINTL